MQDSKANNAQVKVEIATSINFGNYKACKPVATQLSNFIKLNWKKITQEFNLPDLLTIKIRPIKGSWVGWARQEQGGKSYSIEVDPRRDTLDKVLDTLFHELTHIDQYVTGRLKHKNGERIWCGSFVPDVKVQQVHSSQKNIDKYRSQPWEVEARYKGEQLRKKYWAQFVCCGTPRGSV
jgi:hypothetical protein